MRFGQFSSVFKEYELTAGDTRQKPVPILVVEEVVVERVEVVEVVVVETPQDRGVR